MSAQAKTNYFSPSSADRTPLRAAPLAELPALLFCVETPPATAETAAPLIEGLL